MQRSIIATRLFSSLSPQKNLQVLTRKELEPYLGSRARVAEVLNRARPLTLEMIRKLSEGLGLPADILVSRYALRDAA